ncbi:MAG TPA: hypothetical protein VIK07_00400 [Bacteroidales bacterium]
MRYKHITAIFILLFSITFTARSQKIVNTPYSRFNIGSIDPAGSFRSLGMGGVSTAMRDNNAIYFSNPASYSSIDTISFLFDFGIDYSMSFLSDSVSKYSSDDINFDHIIMGFPIAKGWGFALGVIPISSGYYKISVPDISNDNSPDKFYSSHSGDGGLSNFFMGTGKNINKHFSVGVNMTVLFGKLERYDTIQFFDSRVFNDLKTEKLQLGGVNLEYGLQYTTNLKNDYFLNAGVSFRSGKNYRSNYEMLSYRYTAFSDKDTVSYISDNSTKAFIPGSLSLGIAFGKKNKFTTGLDFVSTKWSKASIPGSSGYAADTKSLLFGAALIPDKTSNYSFLKRVEYRFGAHYGDNYLVIKGEQLKEYGASFGIGIPMSRSFSDPRSLSKINLFIDYTRKTGSAGSFLPVENYFTMGISLNLHDFWFQKRKYE